MPEIGGESHVPDVTVLEVKFTENGDVPLFRFQPFDVG